MDPDTTRTNNSDHGRMGERMKPLITDKTVKTVKTHSDSDSHLLSQPLKGVAVTVKWERTCLCCQYWTGAPDSITAMCKLHRDCHSFRVTGRDATCPSFTAGPLLPPNRWGAYYPGKPISEARSFPRTKNNRRKSGRKTRKHECFNKIECQTR